MNKPFLLLIIIIFLIVVACTPKAVPTSQPSTAPSGGGCGVAPLTSPNMQEADCQKTKEGVHCTAKVGF